MADMVFMERLRGSTRPNPDSASCPSDAVELAEAFWMRKLDHRTARRFVRHCHTCPDCAHISQRAREFIRAIRAALAEHPPLLVYKCRPVLFGAPPRR